MVNCNVSTRGHRDWGDQDICMIIVISDCSGGELCLYEPGMVLKLRNGDMAVFTSADTTHFNLHFQGRRSSFVFHSDRFSKSWNKDCNGWKDHINFH